MWQGGVVGRANIDTPPQQKKLKVSIDMPNTLGSDLWETDEFTDVELVVDGERFRAHKMVLASQSAYFRGLLYGGMREALLKTITLPEDIITPVAFKKVLRYAYTRSLKVEESLDDILVIIRVADYLQFDVLKSTLAKQVAENICHDNVLQIYMCSDSNNLQLPEVEGKCLEFIEEESNIREILKSKAFLELPEQYLVRLISRDSFVAPELKILEAVLRWKNHNKKDVSEMLEVVKCIRLSLFSTKEIFTKVESTGIFSETDILAGLRIILKPDLSAVKPRGRLKSEENLLDMARIEPLCQSPLFWKIGKFPYSRHGSQIKNGTITLPKSYLVNCLHFQAYPIATAENQSKWFSYVVRVSLDDQTPLELFNYSSFYCRGRQVLMFPTIRIKEVCVRIDSTEDDRAIPVKLLTLKHSNDHIPFKFMLHGVIAPLTEHKVEFIPYQNGIQTAGASFNQPYSASTVSIEVLCDDPIASQADVNVLLGERMDKKEQDPAQCLKNVDIRSPICVMFKEMVIGYLEVTVTNWTCYAECGPSSSRPVSEHVPPVVTITGISCTSSATADASPSQFYRYLRQLN